MTTLINARFLTRQATGVDRFASEIIAKLHDPQTLLPGVSLLVPKETPRPVSAAVAGNWVPVGFGQGHFWEQVSLARYHSDEMLINLCNTAPAYRRNQLVVVHDAATVATPANYSRSFRRWYRFLLQRVLRNSARIATVSAFSADELARYFDIDIGRLAVIPESGEHILRWPADNRILTRLGITDRPYVLAVGSQARNKNLSAIVKAFSQLDHPGLNLVLAGGSNPQVFADTTGPDSRVIQAGYVSDAELRALYENAEMFVFPSFYEGFGLPPLEAMSCGCPVIVSDRAALPETCGGAALYCNPDEPSTLSAQMSKIYDSRELAQSLKLAGLARAKQFSWREAASCLRALIALPTLASRP